MLGVRANKLMGIERAVRDLVREGCTLAVGGNHLSNNPMALVRELIRQKKHVKTLVTGPAASMNADMIIGAGLAREIISPYVGFEDYGPAPNHKGALESGKLIAKPCDILRLTYGLRAGAGKLGYMPLPKGAELSQLVHEDGSDYATTRDPFTGEIRQCVSALEPDVAFVHCPKADEFGNGLIEGAQFAELDIILASKKTILLVEELVPHYYMTNNTRLIAVPSFLVSAVVQWPFGCHPTASQLRYNYDEEHLFEYFKACRSDFDAYLEKYVFSPKDSDDYIKAVGGYERLNALKEGLKIWEGA